MYGFAPRVPPIRSCFLLVWLLATLLNKPVAAKPPFPTRKQIEDAFQPQKLLPNTCLLWSNFPQNKLYYFYYINIMEDWAEPYKLLTVNDIDLWSTWQFPGAEQYTGTASERSTFIKDKNEVYASHCQGKAYLAMPAGTAPPADGRFWTEEWPILRDGGKVTEIIWIDPAIFPPATEPGYKPPPIDSYTTTWWVKGGQPATVPQSTTSSSTTALPTSTSSTSSMSSTSSTMSTNTKTNPALQGGFFNKGPSTTSSTTTTSTTSSTSTTTTTTKRRQGLAGGFLNKPKSTSSSTSSAQPTQT